MLLFVKSSFDLFSLIKWHISVELLHVMNWKRVHLVALVLKFFKSLLAFYHFALISLHFGRLSALFKYVWDVCHQFICGYYNWRASPTWLVAIFYYLKGCHVVETADKLVSQHIRLYRAVLLPAIGAACFLKQIMPGCLRICKADITCLASPNLGFKDVNAWVRLVVRC